MEKISEQVISQRIHFIRGHRVMLDSDLAELYGVETRNLNKAVKRNITRFPGDFMLQLTDEEWTNLKFQIGTSRSAIHGGRRKLPKAFTQEGVAMLSSVLNSESAVQVNIEIMRAFVRIRELMMGNKELARKLSEIEKKYESHDAQFKVVFDAIRQLIHPTLPAHRRKVGFKW